MEIGNTVEISDQNFYLGAVFIKSGDELPDPKFRLMTHIRRYGGLEINFKNILFLKKNDFFFVEKYLCATWSWKKYFLAKMDFAK